MRCAMDITQGEAGWNLFPFSSRDVIALSGLPSLCRIQPFDAGPFRPFISVLRTRIVRAFWIGKRLSFGATCFALHPFLGPMPLWHQITEKSASPPNSMQGRESTAADALVGGEGHILPLARKRYLLWNANTNSNAAGILGACNWLARV